MKTPTEVIESTYTIATNKCNCSLWRTLLLSILAGIYIAMGGALAVLVGFGMPGLSEANPSITKLLMGLAFPIGLALITLLGADLFTGNCATLIPSLMRHRITIPQVLKNWGLVWCGNFIGALFFAYCIIYISGIFQSEPWYSALHNLALAKTSQSFLVIFVKGIGANWFVCLAVWAALTAKSVGSKLAALWFPVATFVMLGFEHSIANMFFIPVAMFYSADVSIYSLFIDNLLPATLGNIVGGALFVGCAYSVINAPSKC
ncbi:MAG: formate/nitrite transporter family protein [Muribaculaceae bacterium]|nr:formate/nitrite transporter family protein [Muribaculaceae bacterium]